MNLKFLTFFLALSMETQISAGQTGSPFINVDKTRSSSKWEKTSSTSQEEFDGREDYKTRPNDKTDIHITRNMQSFQGIIPNPVPKPKRSALVPALTLSAAPTDVVKVKPTPAIPVLVMKPIIMNQPLNIPKPTDKEPICIRTPRPTVLQPTITKPPIRVVRPIKYAPVLILNPIQAENSAEKIPPFPIKNSPTLLQPTDATKGPLPTKQPVPGKSGPAVALPFPK
jgi:hypothetical protein